MKKLSLLLFISVFCSLKSQETIETDRPDQTETTAITLKNFVQIETGFLYQKNAHNSSEYSHPTVLWKYGINENFELRMETEFNAEKSANEKISGIVPLTFGFKSKLVEEKKLLPAISFLGHLEIGNWASKPFQNPYLAPKFRFLFQHTLSDKINLSYNIGAEWNGETPDATGIYTVSASYKISEKLGTFTELYGFLNKYEKADHRFDAGFTYLLNDNLMIDASSGFGISEISPQYFLSCGISYRFAAK